MFLKSQPNYDPCPLYGEEVNHSFVESSKVPYLINCIRCEDAPKVEAKTQKVVARMWKAVCEELKDASPSETKTVG